VLSPHTALFDGDSDSSDVGDDAVSQGTDSSVGTTEGNDDEAPPAKRQRLSSVTEVKVVEFSFGGLSRHSFSNDL
jgi:hypothetical protein